MDNNTAIQRMKEADHLFILYSRATRHPFASYDEAAGKDRISVFLVEEMAETGKAQLEKYGYLVQIVDMPRENRTSFFVNLHALGIDEVMYHDQTEKIGLAVSEVQPIDLNQIPRQQRPHLNPPLQLTSIYFLQEMSRNVKAEDLTQEDRRARQDLEEQFSHYLATARYMLPIHVKNMRGGKPGQRISEKNFDPVYVSDSQGKNWIPVFSDVTEFEKFNDRNQFQAVLIGLPQLQQLLKSGMEGILYNPRSQSYRLMPKAVGMLIEAEAKRG